MNSLTVSLNAIQHISSLTYEIDLSNPGLCCLVGRNGAGKTTLVRALRNLSSADTFIKTAGPSIFSDASSITYKIDGKEIIFTYDPAIGSLNCRQAIPKKIRRSISVELPIPYGARFSYAKSASMADGEIRKKIVLGTPTRPNELIYANEKYDSLIEASVRGKSYYAIVSSSGRYIREDYLSSGEYFLINLYRTIKSATKLIVIDEIDLSLDAAAQAKLAEWLREFCKNYGCKILFTTHSLAVMRTLHASEIFYMEKGNTQVTFTPASYSYVKARLFGFRGWDKYILTEDKTLLGFIEYLLFYQCPGAFFSCKIIYAGGGSQVADLLNRNVIDEFLAVSSNVIAIIDGDQKGMPHASIPNMHLIPIESIEKELYRQKNIDPNFPFRYERVKFTSDKDFFNYLYESNVATIVEIYAYLFSRNEEAFKPLIELLSGFLGHPNYVNSLKGPEALS